VERAIAIDPALPGLDAAERFERSQKLLEESVGSLDQCLAGSPAPALGEVRNLVDAARKTLLRHGASIALAQKIWAERIKQCGPATIAEEPLSIVMTQLSR
jgi:hypothetical protein